MSESADANLQLKKRARRRLVGAIAFAGLAAVVLPMIMDDEPKQQVQDVQIRIPGQDQLTPIPKPSRPNPSVEREKAGKAEKSVVQPVESAPPKVVEKKEEKSAPAPTVKTEKTPEHASDKAPEKPAAKPAMSEAQRAAAILEGKNPTSAGKEEYVILIGAFANPGNVKVLQNKIGELGIKVYTEPLDSPSGKKTRVRAGPFPSRDAAESALGKMKRIGVNGIVSTRK